MQGQSGDLTFADNTFDAAIAVLTIHQWSDPVAGVRQMRRVTRGRLAFLTYDPTIFGFWLADYFPALAIMDRRHMPTQADW